MELDTWKKRRKFMYLCAVFCMASIGWILVTGLDTESAEAAVTFAFLTLSGTVGSYVFGAVYEDTRK